VQVAASVSPPRRVRRPDVTSTVRPTSFRPVANPCPAGIDRTDTQMNCPGARRRDSMFETTGSSPHRDKFRDGLQLGCLCVLVELTGGRVGGEARE
jgi:hypothetical protein